MHNKQTRSCNLNILHFVLLMPFLVAAAGYTATEKQNTDTKSTDQAKPVVERKSQPSEIKKETNTFVPTEKISADKGISFPTDI